MVQPFNAISAHARVPPASARLGVSPGLLGIVPSAPSAWLLSSVFVSTPVWMRVAGIFGARPHQDRHTPALRICLPNFLMSAPSPDDILGPKMDQMRRGPDLSMEFISGVQRPRSTLERLHLRICAITRASNASRLQSLYLIPILTLLMNNPLGLFP